MDESEMKKNKNFYFIKIKLDQILEYCLTWMLDRTWTLSFRKDRTECVIFDGVKKSEIGALRFHPSTQCNKRARMIQGCAKKRKKWALEKFYGIYIHICISEIYRALAASALKYGRFIWFSSYVRHKFPLNLEFRSRAHQPTLPRHLPSPS